MASSYQAAGGALAACLLLAGGHAHAQAGLAKGAPVLDVQSLAVLSGIEQKGFGLAALLGADRAGSLRELYRDSRAYRTLADQVGQDVLTLREDMQANGRLLYVVTDQNAGRVMDVRWLQSPLAAFRLVGSSTGSTARILPTSPARRAAARCASSTVWPIESRTAQKSTRRACRSSSSSCLP